MPRVAQELATLNNDVFLGQAGLRTIFMLEVINGVGNRHSSSSPHPHALSGVGGASLIARAARAALRWIDIVRYSAFEDAEAEVLLYPGTMLEVVDSLDVGSGLFQVHLRELDVPASLCT